MPVSDPASPVSIELSRAEQWVAHHVLLDAIGLADGSEPPAEEADPADPQVAAITKLESGTFEFTVEELGLLRRACAEHARTTEATADRNLASAVADRIGSSVERQGVVLEE